MQERRYTEDHRSRHTMSTYLDKGVVIWLTGLPGAGKTTIGKMLYDKIRSLGFNAELLDGDELRKNISSELGFSRNDRETHAKRVAFLSHLLSRNGVITIVALISPFRSSRSYARDLNTNFLEVYVKCPIEICQKRDPKGLYSNAAAGKISNMTGVQDPYEEPLNPELVIDTEHDTPTECAGKIMRRLEI